LEELPPWPRVAAPVPASRDRLRPMPRALRWGQCEESVKDFDANLYYRGCASPRSRLF
jgi:hypothetical protein